MNEEEGKKIKKREGCKKEAITKEHDRRTCVLKRWDGNFCCLIDARDDNGQEGGRVREDDSIILPL